VAALAIALVVVFACAPPPKTVANLSSSTPSPSPIPTAPLQASSAPFHGGEVGVAYAAVVLSATGGVAPYAWTVSSGALPPGLTVGPSGSVSGSPTGAGSFSFTIRVADAGTGAASLPGVIGIAAPLSASLIPCCAHYCRVELGCVTVCGGFGTLSGGVGPYNYTLTQGPLPAGTSLTGLSLTGTFGGLSGYLKFTVQVADAMGASATVAPTFWMYDHIALASGSCLGNYITGCSVNLPTTGGIPGSAVSVKLLSVAANPKQGCWNQAAAPPPAGYGLSVSGGSVVVSIPKQIINGYGGVWTLAVNDSSLCAASTYCISNQATVVIGVQCG